MPSSVVTPLVIEAARGFALFCDVRHLPVWVPGLRRAVVVREGAPGFPLEVKYEFAASRTYSLVYVYDAAAHRVAWVPGLGARDAVDGEAVFTAAAGGCELSYRLGFGAARTAGENAVGDAEKLTAAFAAFVKSLR